MRTLVAVGLLLLSSSGVFAGEGDQKKDAPKTAKERYAAIQKDRSEAMQAFSKAYAKAKTPKEKGKLFSELYPKPEKYAKRYLQVAKDHPDDPVAVKALREVLTLQRSGAPFKEALAILGRRHVKSKEMGQVCQRLIYAPSPATETLLRRVLKENPHHDVQGMACYSLARYLKQLARMAEYLKSQPNVAAGLKNAYGEEFLASVKKLKPADVQKETEQLFERVVKEYGDVKTFRGTLKKAAAGNLYEIRYLSVGKVAPEIEGEDIDGVKFKLSDYRGKVVLLDFWGDW